MRSLTCFVLLFSVFSMVAVSVAQQPSTTELATRQNTLARSWAAFSNSRAS